MRLSTEYRPPLSSECLKRVGGVSVGLLEKNPLRHPDPDVRIWIVLAM